MKQPAREQIDIDNGRRKFIQACVGTAAAFASTPLWSAVNPLPERSLSFLSLHTGESVKVTYWSENSYLDTELKMINEVLRDHRTGDIYPIDQRLLDQLFLLKNSIGTSHPFHVISGYRSPKTNQKLRSKSNGVAKRSLHMQGKAIDIRVPGIELTDLRDAAKSLKMGGVGYYAKSNFIHIDTGRVRYW
ncbi:MAG: DUF882 domain-containing protein [Gammaproteobacteria bacterium]|nr:MAG: DUF882 domain-containing protein [Gammaproteobacteria bacterium]